ncbi:ankyrin-1-like [Mytilus californianus]|uniref:ankyrin-1-like n=1 Tax=Mytilus californianus TaxID=6549 RepID=UPI002246DCED|nr:ankyrin-1-like [Mytilus californianus]
MTCLLRNLSNINIQDNLPVSTDTTEGAALARIKFYRNEIAHNDSGTLTEQQFHHCWKEVGQAITLLGGQNYTQLCADLKVCNLDGHDKEILIELRNIRSEIPKGATVVHNSLLEEWSRIDEKVVQTKAFQRILELLHDEHVLTVIGPPGCGKSIAIHHAALQLRDKEDYVIVPVNFPGEIIQYYNPECKQVFVYDDICGKYAINLQMVDNWCVLSNAIQVILSSKYVKILSSCRNYIFKDRCFSKVKLLSEVHVDITSPKYALSEKERSLIAEVYLSAKEVTVLQKSNIFTKYDFFPLLCQLYSSKESSDVEVYFSDPIEAINIELESLMNETDQTTFATLFLFVIYNNCIDENIFSRKVEIRNILLDLSDHFEISSVLSINVVKLQLNKLIDSFVKKFENSYCILHDKIFDILVLFCGNKHFDLCLKVAHTDIIRDRFQFQSFNADESEGIILVAANKEDAYFDRISNDIRDGHIENVFTNIQITYTSYQQNLLKHLENNEDLRNNILSLSEKESSPLLTVANQGFNYLVHSLIDIGFNVNVLDKNGRSPLFLATDSDYIETVELLLNKAAHPDLCDNKKISPLHMACLNDDIEMVKLLINSKCSIDIRTDYGHTPLFFASLLGHTEIVSFLLEHKCDININSRNNNTPLHAACFLDNAKIVQLLIDFECDPIILSVYDESALFVACLNNSILSAGLLLEKGLNPNMYTHVEGKYNPRNEMNEMKTSNDALQDDLHQFACALLLENGGLFDNLCAKHVVDMNWLSFIYLKGPLTKPHSSFNMTPLFIASSSGFIDLVELLLEREANPNLGNGFNETPLFSAAEKGYIEIVNLLFEFKADPNLCNNYNVSPLQAAAVNGFSEIVSLLLINGANPNHNDDDNGPPLILATHRCFYDIVEILLKFNADPNINNVKGETCLHLATHIGEVEIVRLLLQNHADPNAVDNSLNTPLHIASHAIRNYVIITSMVWRNIVFMGWEKLFISYLDDISMLFHQQFREIVKLLLRYKADPFSVV